MKEYTIKNTEGGVDKFIFNPEGKGAERYKLNGNPLTGVTTALGVINKPSLIGWAARMAYEHALELAQSEGKTLESFRVEIEAILKDKKYAHAKKSKNALDIGKEAHAWVEEWANNRMKGLETPLPTNEAIKRVVEPFVAWANGKMEARPKKGEYDKNSICIAPKNPIKVLASEQSVCSRKYWYGGTFDLVIEIDGRKYVADFKTSSGIYGREYFAQCAAYRHALEEMGWDSEIAGSVILRSGKEGEDFEVALSTDYKSDFKLFLAALAIYKGGYADFDIDF